MTSRLPGSYGWWILGLLLLAGALRLMILEQVFPIRLMGDENYYLSVAGNIASGAGHRHHGNFSLRPPAHPFLLSFFVVSGDRLATLHGLLLSQVFLSTLLVGLTALLGRALFDRCSGLVAAALVAVYPTFLGFSHYLWSENLFTVLVTTGLLGAVHLDARREQRGPRRRDWAFAALLGLVFGAATLTRELALPLACVLVLWWTWMTWSRGAPARRRRQLRTVLGQGALVIAVTLLVVSPWTHRNYRIHQRFIPVATVGWYAAYEGNLFKQSDWMARTGIMATGLWWSPTRSKQPELERMDRARKQTLAAIRAEQPTWIFKKTARGLTQLFEPDSYLLRKLRLRSYGIVSTPLRRLLLLASVLVYAATLLGGVAGVAAARQRGRKLLPCLVFLLVAGVHILGNSSTRFRVPWMPLLTAYAAYAALHWRTLPRLLSGWRWVVPVAFLLFFLAVCVPYSGPEFGALW